ncbi:MAG: hypothetical protein HYY25_00470 [Candidatus Wallbacteria bacterium]|nr:hypothetical protein [Candidatus Wallbacteria bacterium]
MNKWTTYQPSGRTDWSRLLRSLGWGLPLAALLGGLYQLILYWFPYGLVWLCSPVVLGFVLGVLAYRVEVHGHCRNKRVALLIALLLSLTGLTASHGAAFQIFVMKVAPGQFLPKPNRKPVPPLEKYLSLRQERGFVLHHKNSSATELAGGFVKFFWGLEALAVLWFGTLLTRTSRSEPYCEDCHDWLAAGEVAWKPGFERQALNRALSHGTLSALLDIQSGLCMSAEKLVFTHLLCNHCSRLHYVSVVRSWREPGPEGKPVFGSEEIGRNLRATPGDIARLKFESYTTEQVSADALRIFTGGSAVESAGSHLTP